MKILFICRRKSGFKKGISPIVKNQADSLIKTGNHIEYFIVDNGIRGYIKLLFNLRKYIKINSFDIIHSHYSITSIFVSIAIPKKKIIVSLMGSDTERKGIMLVLIRLFSKLIWKHVIVKTEKMKNRFKSKNIQVLPNGVDFDHFTIIPKEEALQKVGFSPLVKNILFLAESNRKEKNVSLARQAVKILNDPMVVLHEIYPVPHEMVPFYLNAADVLVLSSEYEGSVNIIKEGMACRVPIVSTDVGDVKENISSTEGCYIASHNAVDFSEKITAALNFSSKTNGRDNINHLNSLVIAEKLIGIYKTAAKC